MHLLLRHLYALLMCVLAASGCQWLDLSGGRPTALPSPNNFLRSSNELHDQDVMLEVIFIRCPYGDPRLNELWGDADEQMLAPELRQQLANNGFRVGVVGNQIPYSLMQLMGMRSDVAPSPGVACIRLDEMANTPLVVRADVPARNNHRNEILASAVKKEATILYNEKGTPGGKTYLDVQGVFGMKTQQKGDGRVKIEIIPELQYGEVRRQFSSDAGAARIIMSRPKQTFESLRSELTVGPGQIIIVSNIEDRQGNLGYFFLTDDEADMRYQKIMCIRVRHTPQHDMFSPDGTLPLDVATEEELLGN